MNSVASKVDSTNATCTDSSLGLLLEMSFGKNCRDTAPEHLTVSLEEFTEMTRDPKTKVGGLNTVEFHALDKQVPAQKRRRDAEKDGPYFITAKFRRSGSRRAEDVESICAFVLDFDDGKTALTDVKRLIGGKIFYVAWTSYSHTPSMPRLRVVIPYAVPIAPSLHPNVYDHFMRVLDGHPFDPRSKTTAQLWYLPSCPHDAVADFQHVVSDGPLFDPTALPPLDPQPAAPAGVGEADSPTTLHLIANATFRDVQSALGFIDSEDRETWIKVGMALKDEFGPSGRSIWDEWSRQSDKFDEAASNKAWESFTTDRRPRVMIATVFYLARENGWASPSESELSTQIDRINRQYFFAPLGGKSFVWEERTHPVTGHVDLVYMSKADFIARFANKTFSTSPRKNARRINLGEAWFSSPRRRQFDGVIFAPGEEVPGHYNLYRGFSVQPKPGSWDHFRAHLREVICSGDDVIFDYLQRWLAHAVQRPAEMPQTAIVMRGGRGAGKGTVARWLGELFRPHFCHISQSRHLVGNFNSHLEQCLLLFVDEGFWAGDKQGEATLKALITEPTLAIERKGVDVQSARNYLRIMMASNSDWVIPAGHDERRFLVLDVCGERANDASYFELVNEEMRNGGLEGMLHDLLHLDLTNFNVRSAPKTQALLEQKILSLPSVEAWIYHILRDGRISTYIDWGDIETSMVQHEYMCFAGGASKQWRSTATEIGMRLTKVIGVERVRKTATRAGVRHWCYRFPPLIECRRKFETYINQEIDWGVDGEDSTVLPVLPSSTSNRSNEIRSAATSMRRRRRGRKTS